jgi:hypothetical protein
MIMAEEFSTEGQEGLDGAEGQTGDAQTQMTDDQMGEGQGERFTEERPEDPNDPQYKYWQGAYTKTRQRDRERYGQLETEHKQYGDVLRNFYQSDEYALQVLRQRFPQLANQLSFDGTRQSQVNTPQTSSQNSAIVAELEQSLGKDLAFLAPSLGPVMEKVVQAATRAALAPYEQRTQQQAEAERKRQEDSLLAQMDSTYPGWEQRYGKDMQELDAFLGGDSLTHPKYGNKYELLMKLVNPDLARIDAAKSMQTAAKSRLTTGRTGRPSQPNLEEQILATKSNADAFQLAVQAALREHGMAS